MFRNLFRKAPSSPTPTLEQEIATAALRMAVALRDAGLNPADPVASAESLIDANRSSETAAPPADLSSDLAAYLGEHARTLVGGIWGDDPLFGIAIVQPGGIPDGVLGPYQLVRKKWQLGSGMSLANFFANLPDRIAAESHRPTTPLPRPSEAGEPLVDFAEATAEQSRAILSRDLGEEVPATLVGLRTAERWLRGHFLLRTAPGDDFDRLGFLVGEVMRGLYGGEWNLDQARKTDDWSDAALMYPELPFFPVGRILKLLVEQPEGNGLDDYVRLVPAARRDLRRDGFNPITGQTL